jgi:hypothetical protein
VIFNQFVGVISHDYEHRVYLLLVLWDLRSFNGANWSELLQLIYVNMMIYMNVYELDILLKIFDIYFWSYMYHFNIGHG